MLSSRTIAAIAKIAPTLRSIFPFTITMVMPMAMIPIGADCLSSSSMFSQSMKALSDRDRYSPATEKKISSSTMKPQIAPPASALESLPFCMVLFPHAIGDQSLPRLAAISSQTARMMMTQVTTNWT